MLSADAMQLRNPWASDDLFGLAVGRQCFSSTVLCIKVAASQSFFNVLAQMLVYVCCELAYY